MPIQEKVRRLPKGLVRNGNEREREREGGGGSGVTKDELENELAGRFTLNQRHKCADLPSSWRLPSTRTFQPVRFRARLSWPHIRPLPLSLSLSPSHSHFWWSLLANDELFLVLTHKQWRESNALAGYTTGPYSWRLTLAQVRQNLKKKKNFWGWLPAIAFLYLISNFLFFFLLSFFLKTNQTRAASRGRAPQASHENAGTETAFRQDHLQAFPKKRKHLWAQRSVDAIKPV